MQLYELNAAPTKADDLVCGESRRRFVSVLTFLTAAEVGLLFLRRWHEMGFFFWVISAGILLCALVFAAQFRHALRTGNWVLRYDGSRLFIKYRSYLNEHLPADKPVVFAFEATEIESLSKVDKQISYPRDDERTTERLVYLAIRPIPSLLPDIQSALAAERQLRAKASSSWDVQPVSLADGILRVQWLGPASCVAPGIDRTLQALAASFPVRPEPSADAAGAADDARKQQESDLLELIACGRTMPAIALARELYGYSLSEARQFVESFGGVAEST